MAIWAQFQKTDQRLIESPDSLARLFRYFYPISLKITGFRSGTMYANPDKMCDIIIHTGHRGLRYLMAFPHFLNKAPSLRPRISKADYAITENVKKLPAAKTLQSRI